MSTPLTGGFADPARQSASAFRAVLEAMSRPGRIATVSGAEPPAPLSLAAGVVMLTLCDAETPVWLSPRLATPAVMGWMAFHCGAPLSPTRAGASFGFGTWEDLLPLTEWPPGTADYPDRAATLIVERPDLAPTGTRLTGPGIAGATWLNLPDTGPLRANRARFPLGIDLILTAGDRLAALPRSTTAGA